MDRSIKPGYVFVVGEAGGEVSPIGTRAVSVTTRDRKEYLISNEFLMTERAENWNYRLGSCHSGRETFSAAAGTGSRWYWRPLLRSGIARCQSAKSDVKA